MWEQLTGKFESLFRKIKGYGHLDENNIQEALREIRIALLEADVNFKVVKNFVEEVKSEAIGEKVMQSLSPGQQVVKIVYEKLTTLLGGTRSTIKYGERIPSPILLVGLQGSGKTTTAVKLARLLMKEGKRVALVSSDVYRPAAAKQLEILGKKIGAYVVAQGNYQNPVDICKNAWQEARREGYEVLIIDTAGRLHIDEAMMEELRKIKDALLPSEILLIADAMTGQDAVLAAAKFHELLGIDGVILTKLDGDARGGAALSIKATIGKPIKFVGIGEKLEDIEVFYPERMASRILGMGDVLSLVEKVQATINEQERTDWEKKLKKAEFTLDDFKEHIEKIRKMGNIKDIIGMIPGLNKMKLPTNLMPDDKELIKITAIINSMTKKERMNYKLIDGRRRLRIARGSGTSVQDVNRVLKNYEELRKLMKKVSTKEGKKALKKGNFFI